MEREPTRVGELLDGKYRLVERLGGGGMADVYRAQHETIGRAVAIKVMLRKHAVSAVHVLRFLREGRAANMAHHPNIVHVVDVGLDDKGVPYIVQELLEGEDLGRVLARSGRLRAGEALRVLRPIVAAVAAAHACGVVHRDLKPENVFLARTDDGQTVPKILDFGISKIVRGAVEGDLTAAGTTLGTPAYMAPEMLERAGQASSQSDVWALGVLLFEAVTGRLPFASQQHAALTVEISSVAALRLADVAPDAPPALALVVDRCMRRDPSERFADASELGQALDEIVVMEGIDVTIDTAPVRSDIAMTLLAGPQTLQGLAVATGSPSQAAPTTLATKNDPSALGFGLVAHREPVETSLVLAEFCRRVRGRTGQTLRPCIEASPAALADAFRRRTIHLAWAGATLVMLSEDMAGAVPLVSSIREGVALYHAVLFSRADAPFETLESLAGVRVAWVAPTSASGCILPRASIRRRGLDAARMFREEHFVGSHVAVARAVFSGRADVGATYAIFERGDVGAGMVRSGFLDAAPDQPVRVLDLSGPIPGDLIVAAPDVDASTRDVLRKGIIDVCADIEGGALVRGLFGADGLRAAPDDALDDVREFLDNTVGRRDAAGAERDAVDGYPAAGRPSWRV